MLTAPIRWALLLLSPCWVAAAQSIDLSRSMDSPVGVVQISRLNLDFYLVNSQNANTTEVQSPTSSISRLDLKAPRKARHEYGRGYQLLMRKDLQGAVDRLTRAIAIYPSFVAARNALGSAYLEMGKNQEADSEFTQAIALDGHLPNSYLNLGCAELALQHYAAAEASLRKASSMAPLDVQLKLALAYGEFVNHDYPAVIATAQQVTEHEQSGAAIVHFLAAGAFEAQGDLVGAQQQMETLLAEDPQSASAGQFRKILEQIEAEQAFRANAALRPALVHTVMAPAQETSEELARRHQLAFQQKEEEKQIAEAEAAPDPACMDCVADTATAGPAPGAAESRALGGNSPSGTLQINVNEISEFFAATDHGRPVTDLTASDVKISDNGNPPDAILGFRNESQLPLRLGFVIDASDSVRERFSFEQAAATKFLQETAGGKDDLAFVVGVNNVVLLAQDFTADQRLTARALSELVPGGGTALWDAVAYAADRLAGLAEIQPVARVLVVISDGEDNSSSMTLKQAIAHAQRDEVAVYTISTSGDINEPSEAVVGSHALAALSALTGGAAFSPDSIHELNRSLADLEQVIRSRYLISYKPASFQLDGKYRIIDLEVQKDGRQLKVFARKGYYASATLPLDH